VFDGQNKVLRIQEGLNKIDLKEQGVMKQVQAALIQRLEAILLLSPPAHGPGLRALAGGIACNAAMSAKGYRVCLASPPAIC